MTETNSSPDLLDMEDAKTGIPPTINALTILTFIGSGLLFVFNAILPFILDFAKKTLDNAGSMSDLSSDKLEQIEKSRTLIELQQKNMVVLLITTFAAIGLCVAGAILMRKLRKDGFWLYVAGELLPLIVGAIIFGMAQFTGWGSYVSYLVPVVFIALYAGQMKHLK